MTARAMQLQAAVRAGAPLVARGLGKRFAGREGEVEALKPTDLAIAAGEFVAVVGPSGCGKSTLCRLLAGLVPPTAGAVEVDGAGVDGPISDVGIVFQDAVLLDWKTVIDNVLLQARVRRMPKDAARVRAHELLDMAGLGGFARRRPYELSGGMRQRVSLCRALLHEPRLLLMDEPFGALDALTRESMASELQTLWMESRCTVVFVTHSIPEAVLLADRVIVMSARPGRIVADIPIALDRPRWLSRVVESPAFYEPAREIRKLLDVEHLPAKGDL